MKTRYSGLNIAMGGVLAAAVGWAATGVATATVIEPFPPAAPPALDDPPPEPPNLMDFIKNRDVAIALGKALFWDLQLGSGGIQACASCHFQAGADNRITNTVSPGLNAGDTGFEVVGPNGTLTPTMFPFHKRAFPFDRQDSVVVSDANDVVSSQGSVFTEFVDITPFSFLDQGLPLVDPVFQVAGMEVKRVEPRNTPTMINAGYNFANFWDGRANNVFNGQNPFGRADTSARVLVNNGGVLADEIADLINSSLASQAVGPPLSDFEMSFLGRTFAKLGKKMLRLRPLGRQFVHPNDSVLGPLVNPVKKSRGLAVSYGALIAAAFQDRYWNNFSQIVSFDTAAATLTDFQGRTFAIDNGPRTIKPLRTGDSLAQALATAGSLGTDEFLQVEANFALFFGLAVQLYENTLVSDNSRFDQRQRGEIVFTAREEEGLEIFLTDGECINCHIGPLFTGATVGQRMEEDEAVIERMAMAQGVALYDGGFYNIGVRPTAEDIGRGGTFPADLPGFGGFPLCFSRQAKLLAGGTDVPDPVGGVNTDNFEVPGPILPNERDACEGAFKVPGLRNVELTGPYFHNGGVSTLRQVVDFYVRGGNFPDLNIDNLDPDINEIGALQGNEERKDALVAFLLTLTDERVRWEEAPFDHPELFVPNGHPGDAAALSCANTPAPTPAGGCTNFIRIPQVGAGGRAADNLPPLQSFMGLNPFQP